MSRLPEQIRRWLGAAAKIRHVSLFLAFAAIPCQAQERAVTSSFHPDSSYNAENLLRNAAIHVREQQWAEAIDLYQRVVEQYGDSVAAVPKTDAAADPSGGSTLYVNARLFTQSSLATLPPEARVIYRQRLDPRAEELYREALRKSDLSLARELVRNYFCTSWGDEGLNLLGDLAFREGRFQEALSAYRALVPDPVGPSPPAYPEPEIDPERVVAKKLLCRAALGQSIPSGDIDVLKVDGREPKEKFAGRSGPLAESLSLALGEDHWKSVSNLETRWPTFAGAGNRNGISPDKVDVGSFQWKVDLRAVGDVHGPEADDFRALGSMPRVAAGVDLEPGMYPIVVGDLVVVAQEDRVAAFHLNKRLEPGQKTDPGRELMAWQQIHPTVSAMSKNPGGPNRSARTTVTASGDRIIARLGPSGRGTGGGVLYAMRSNREIEGKLLWRKPASEIPLPVKRGAAGERAVAMFEGTPVADDSRVYVALTEAATETWVYVACLDAETGRVLWVRYLGNASSGFDPMRQMQVGGAIGGRLLTLSDQQVFYQTNMGAVACLDAESGNLSWLAAYPGRDANSNNESKRGLNPAVAAAGLVVVAPEDSPSLYAFDSTTGHLAWKSQPIPQISHVLGAAKGKLFATGDRLYTLDLATGRVLRAWPEAGLVDEGAGRGLLAGDSIYWPTKTGILVLDQETGGSVNSTIPLSQAFGYGGGNLAVGEGYLVVAQRDRLVVFCQNRRLIDRYRLQITENPNQASGYFQLARLAEATNQPEEAAEAYRQTIRLTRRDEKNEVQDLGEAARGYLHRLLLTKASRAEVDRDWKQVRALLEEATPLARTDREMLATRLRTGDAEAASGNVGRCVTIFQEVLGDDRLNRLTVPLDSNRTQRVDLWIVERFRQLISEHGRSIYASQDEAGSRLFASGVSEHDPEQLSRVGRLYPLSLAAPKALRALGELYERTHKWSEAAIAYQRFLTLADSDADRALALLGLARTSEARGDTANARQYYEAAIERYAALDLRRLGIEGTVDVQAKPHLERLIAQAKTGTSPGLQSPLTRKWVRSREGDGQILRSDGAGDLGSLSQVFLVEGTRLVALEAATGERAWESDIGQEPQWVSHGNNSVLCASATEIVSMEQLTGNIVWRFDPRAPLQRCQQLDPFASVGAEARSARGPDPESAIGRLHGFHLQGNQVFAFQGDRTLICLDAANGEVLWGFEASLVENARNEPWINPALCFGTENVVLQLGGSHSILVLDSGTGARKAEFARERDESNWLRPPVALDDERILLVIDARTVVLFDLIRGVDIWSYKDDSALPMAAAPRVLVDRGEIVALFGGQHLARLDPASGKKLWSCGISVEDISEFPQSLVLDGALIYCAVPGRLLAIQLNCGEVQWVRPLNSSEQVWNLGVYDSCLVAFPAEIDKKPGSETQFPLLIIKRNTGQLIQRFQLSSLPKTICLRSDPAILATSQEVLAFQAITREH